MLGLASKLASKFIADNNFYDPAVWLCLSRLACNAIVTCANRIVT